MNTVPHTQRPGTRRNRNITIPRVRASPRTPRFSISTVQFALNVFPNDRTTSNVDAIFSLLKSWSSFTSRVKSEEEQRRLCAAVRFEKYNDGDMIYIPGAQSNSWYFMLRGKCIFVEECETEPLEQDEKLADEYKKLLCRRYDCFRRNFRVIREFGTGEDFGFEDLKGVGVKSHYCMAVGNAELIKIDSFTYNIVNQIHLQNLNEKKMHLISQIAQFEEIADQENSIYFLSGKMKKCNIDSGFIISKDNPIDRGFLIVERGQIQVKKMIDFSKIKVKQEKLRVGDSIIKLPSGVQEINTSKLADMSIIALPGMYEDPDQAFSLYFLTFSECYLLSYEDLKTVVPYEFRATLVNKIVDKRTNREIVDDWITSQRVRLWRVYKKRCEKEAFEFNQTRKLGNDIFRRP